MPTKLQLKNALTVATEKIASIEANAMIQATMDQYLAKKGKKLQPKQFFIAYMKLQAAKMKASRSQTEVVKGLVN